MNRLLFFTLSLLLVLFACKKSGPSNTPAAFYGHWQWTGSVFGPRTITPSPDSTVVLELKAGNLYEVTLNGQLATKGSFQIDSSSKGMVLQFDNVIQPVGNNTTGSSGGVNYIAFNYVQIAQLTLFQFNATSSPGNVLQLVQYPITPVATVSSFKRI